MASNGKAVTGTAVMARSANEGKKKLQSLVRLLHREQNRTMLLPPHRSQDVVVLWTMKLTVLQLVTLFLLLSQDVVVLRTVLRRAPQAALVIAFQRTWDPICPLGAVSGRGGGRHHLRTSTLTLDHTAEHVSTSSQGHNGSMFLKMLWKILLWRQSTQCYPPLKPYKLLMDVSQCQDRLSSRWLRLLMRV